MFVSSLLVFLSPHPICPHPVPEGWGPGRNECVPGPVAVDEPAGLPRLNLKGRAGDLPGKPPALPEDSASLTVPGVGGVGGISRAPFPLTPALSLGEREGLRPHRPLTQPPGPIPRRQPIPPLPEGEGRGEGEVSARAPRRSCSAQVVGAASSGRAALSRTSCFKSPAKPEVADFPIQPI